MDKKSLHTIHLFSFIKFKTHLMYFLLARLLIQLICVTQVNVKNLYFVLQTCQIGLNFASEEEARRFKAAANDLLGRRMRKTGN